MKYKALLVAASTLLAACSPLDALDLVKPSKGIDVGVDTQVGDNDSKVGNGIGTIGDKQHIDISDSTNTTVKSSSGRYHLQGAGADKINVTVNETNPWILVLVAVYIFGRPLAKMAVDKLIALRRKKKNG